MPFSYFNDAFHVFEDPNALPRQVLARDNGYDDGAVEGGWDFGGDNQAPVDDGIDWDEELAINNNSAQDNSVQASPVQDNNSVRNHSVQHHSTTVPCTCGNHHHTGDHSDVDTAVIVSNINPVPASKPGFGNPHDDNPVTINRIPRSQLHPAIGTSATGSYIHASAILGDGFTDYSPTGNSVGGNPVVGAGSNAIGSSVVSSPSFVGNPVSQVIDNIFVNNSVNANLATANNQLQSAGNPVLGSSITGPGSNQAAALTDQQLYLLQVIEAYKQQQLHGIPGAAQGLAHAEAKLGALNAAQARAEALTAIKAKLRASYAAQARAEALTAIKAKLQASYAAQSAPAQAILAAAQSAQAQALRTATQSAQAQALRAAVKSAQAQAHVARQVAAGQVHVHVPSAVTASTSSSVASTSSARHRVNQQPMNNNVVTGNVVTGTNQAVTVSATPAPAPARVLPLLPACLLHERFDFMKLPYEIQLMIFGYVWDSPDPLPAPANARTYQQQLEFYSSPRHLRRQLQDLFKLGSISQHFRKVAYREYFRVTQLYLRYETHWRWYRGQPFGSAELNTTMTSLWDVAEADSDGSGSFSPLSPLRAVLEQHLVHVAWHVGPVFQPALNTKMKKCLEWLQTRCRNIKTIEIIVGFRTAHVRPGQVRDLIARKNKFAGRGMDIERFKGFRHLHRYSVNRVVDELKRKMKTGGCLEKVVFTYEPFVNESLDSRERGTIDLQRLLERSEWWIEWKEEVRRKLGEAEPVKIKKQIEDSIRPYKFQQHLGHLNPKWHKSSEI
ncbi:hypothetical protein SMACR_01777 [Sordaria macrospora]|uniref:Uncharacterized protein n=1 Tax=Sordaria macrospora TaxID=5147 RepID=A0A8S9A872_SORMA|nr:hypothetical protein SMACR_01777 [Sordaria macrospora]KAH7626310.1 hypothetical protein B0T09DRAFT_377324 [Sordaria sp. MPI-SDFR-AT-0083]WPJ61468.1 hypothetical protein SMAC4_01777 [Sordaria macrospora]